MSGRKQPRRASFLEEQGCLLEHEIGTFCLKRAGSPLSEGSCPQSGQAREPEEWLRPPLLSFSGSVLEPPELSRTGYAYFKQELGLHVRARTHMCVCMHFIISEESTLQPENESSVILVNLPAACPSSLHTER